VGVKFNREYKEILTDLTHAVSTIPDCHDFFEMNGADWQKLREDEKVELVQTLADDIFYGLGLDPQMEVGSGQIEYDPKNHVIKVTTDPQVVHIVRLI